MKKITAHLGTLIKGFCIGSSMLVPGVSGGSMAMVLGIYDRLISAVSGFFKEFWKNILFLGIFCVGAGVGFILAASPIDYLLTNFPLPTKLFFIGTVAGGIPLIFKKAEIKKFSISPFVYMAIGAAIVFLISLAPTNLLGDSGGGFAWILTSLVAGIVLSIALILPGISTSHMLYVMGIYPTVTAAIKSLNFLTLLPLIIGTVAGIFLLTGILEVAMKKLPKITYMIILGFVLASLVEIFPTEFAWNWQIPVGIVALLAGFFAIFFLSKMDADEA